MTFVLTKLALEPLPVGAILRVWFDHPPAHANVPRSLRAWGQRVRAVTDAGPDGRFCVDVERTDAR